MSAKKKPTPTRTPKTVVKAKKELRKMLRSLSRKGAVNSYFTLGRFAANNELADGTTVYFSITEAGHYRRPKKD